MSLNTPTAWYNLGSTADTGPNGYTLTNTNGVSFSNPGVIGNCATFDSASSQRLERANETNLQLVGGDFSITTWINPTTIASYPGIMGKGTSAQGWCVFFNSNSDNVLLFYLGGSVDTISLSTGFSTGSFQNMIITRAAGVVRVYRNNVEVGSKTISGTTVGTQSMYLGFANPDGSYFNGKQNLTGIYAGYVFSADDRAALYNGGAGYDPTAPIGGSAAANLLLLGVG